MIRNSKKLKNHKTKGKVGSSNKFPLFEQELELFEQQGRQKVPMSFLAFSSERWGDQSAARLCKILVDSNNGMDQQIMENRTDLLDLMTNEELIQGDDLGLSAVYLAIFYDRPDILRYLYDRGIDLAAPCDNQGFGNIMYYAITLGKSRLIPFLNKLDVSVNNPCEEWFKLTPRHYAMARDDAYALEAIDFIQNREERAFTMLKKHVLRICYSKRYKRLQYNTSTIQRVYRGFYARKIMKMMKRGEITFHVMRSHLTGLGDESGSLGDGGKSDEGSSVTSHMQLSQVEEGSMEDEDSVSRREHKTKNIKNNHHSDNNYNQKKNKHDNEQQKKQSKKSSNIK
jgi:hypothetical protein